MRPLVLGHDRRPLLRRLARRAPSTSSARKRLRDVAPGELVSIGEDGIRTRQVVDGAREAFCVFEYIYFARPDSRMGGDVLQAARGRMGEILAREAPAPTADLVIAVPDSGNPAARGFARASGLPQDDGLIKNRYVARTFIQPGQELRKHGLRLKFNPLPEIVGGRRLVVVDDSIVRGNTTRQIVQMLRDAGAAEVHMRISAPPIRHPCHYGIDMSTREEMIAHERTVARDRRRAGRRLAGLPVAGGRLRGGPRRARAPLRRVLLGRLPAGRQRRGGRQVRARSCRLVRALTHGLCATPAVPAGGAAMVGRPPWTPPTPHCDRHLRPRAPSAPGRPRRCER